MRKYLLPPYNQYKANMHSHSTCSDGRYTVEELKDAYKARGYSIIAFSDHTIVRDHSALNDDNFLALSSAEIDFSQPGPEEFQIRQSCHFNIIISKIIFEKKYMCDIIIFGGKKWLK